MAASRSTVAPHPARRVKVISNDHPVATAKPARLNTADLAYGELRRRIIESELTPGSYLLEQELGLMLGFSRTPIREAALRLQGEGLVQIVPRHGIRIVPTSISDIRHIYQVLISLESTAAGLVAAQPDVDLTPLVDACDTMVRALEAGDMLTWAEADEVFHESLVALSGNARLRSIVMNCRDQVHRVRRFTQRVRPHPQPAKSIEEHRAIIEALRCGDAAKASALYRAHRERGWRDQTAVLQQYGIQQA
ncbi:MULTISPECIES: GntR family transcriptional regulator [unclassified Caballeronia]|uniref:GntR family transcriptional regulator n=1 Tax=unclassified Caballeronia TaxID=2646786 RepID=UPI002862350E|nr:MULTISPECIES: GntR family transcriptional regulator [unclassified Caballeronia]MDR5816848.1 GntR family transcriptional regulator [Caballeronia sp. LZ033]MDR5823759.1 GntR family transcriptional regulator [Caballeronia sp. LZ043]MDR5881655.1 GntR family transcriptional regulator [Caballeronia sp. LZ032]